MFWVRLRSSILIVVIAVVVLYFGGLVTAAGICIVSLIGLYELNRVLGTERTAPGILSYVMTVFYYGMLYLFPSLQTMLFVTAYMALLLIVYVFTYPKYHFRQIAGAFFSLFYVSVMLSYVVRIRSMGTGILVFLIFISAWGCDTCAYCVGMLLGKHKLVPQLSPKKSVEGSIGGMAGATLIGALFGLIFKGTLSALFASISPVLGCALICFAGSIGSQIGDLAASAIKRNYDIKDYGTLIPGHGGILDRFDSVIFVAPVIYAVVLLMIV